MFTEKEMIVEIISEEKIPVSKIEQTIYDLDNQIAMLSSKADNLDYLVAVASGILSAMLDILWVGEFDLQRGQKIADEKVDNFVKKTAKLLGCKDDDIKSCVAYLEDKFPIPSDGNTPDFGGGLQHHLRDFAHHPTIVGLMFSLLTQFTEMSYGTDEHGVFKVIPVSQKSKRNIGKDIPDKLVKGSVIWFFHLVSDMAGSSKTAGLSGGTGIPGPILSLAKEMSALPLFKDIKIMDNSLSTFLSKLFNGTLFSQKDENNNIIKNSAIKVDLRGELGVAIELGRQTTPVIANECIVRTFYFIRRFAIEIKENEVKNLNGLKAINWNNVKPYNNPTLTRMLTIATGVFTTIDITEAIITQKYWISINYVGVGRFAVAIGAETANYLRVRNVSNIKKMYKNIEKNMYLPKDDKTYERISESMDFEKLGLTIKQTEILYNIEYLKTLNDIEKTTPLGKEKLVTLKQEWLEEWKRFIDAGFSDFVANEKARISWYTAEELILKIKENEPEKPWLRLAILESMLFEPYYTLSTEKDKKGKEVPSKKYDVLNAPVIGFNKSEGDKFINIIAVDCGLNQDFVKRIRKTYEQSIQELSEVMKAALTTVSIAATVTIAVIFTAGTFAPAIATMLVGAKFVGLSGAALTSACLAYLGGGAIAVGGLGMAGGTAAIVGGGALLGLGVGAGVGGAVNASALMGKRATIEQSAKLMTSVREIFLNDEKDAEYSNTVYEQYVNKVAEISKDLVDLELKADVASKEEKKGLKRKIKSAEESVKAMRIARKSMLRFNSSFKVGLDAEKE